MAVVVTIHSFSPTSVQFFKDSKLKVQSSGLEEHNGHFPTELGLHITYSFASPTRIPSLPEDTEKYVWDTREKNNEKQLVGATWLFGIKILMNTTNKPDS